MPKPKNKRPSMYDVAELAGVSQTTVSLVINRSSKEISDETDKNHNTFNSFRKHKNESNQNNRLNLEQISFKSYYRNPKQ